MIYNAPAAPPEGSSQPAGPANPGHARHRIQSENRPIPPAANSVVYNPPIIPDEAP